MMRLLILLVLIAVPRAAEAHDSRPLAVKIAVSGEETSLSWRAPPSVEADNAPLVTLAAPCKQVTPGASRPGLEGRLTYSCPKSLARLDIQYPYFNPSLSTVIRLDRGDRAAQSVLLAPDEMSWTPAGARR